MADNFYGAPQNNAEVQAAVNNAIQDEKKKKKKKRLIIIAVIVVVLIVIGIIGSSGGDSDKNNDTNATNSSVAAASSVEADTTENNSNTIGNYGCVVKSAKLTKNWEGADTVLITYEFTNNSKSPASFDVALVDHIYQNGIGLETTFLDDEDTDLLDVEIKPGASKEVKKAYKLRDTSTDLEIEIEELISFSDDKIVTTVTLQK